MRGWEGLKVCQRVPQMPAGVAWGSELESGTFTHKSPCQVRIAPTRGFWTEILFLRVSESLKKVSGQKLQFQGYYFWGTISDRECMGSGVQKVLDRNHGVETHGARRALKRGNFSTNMFFSQKNVF